MHVEGIPCSKGDLVRNFLGPLFLLFQRDIDRELSFKKHRRRPEKIIAQTWLTIQNSLVPEDANRQRPDRKQPVLPITHVQLVQHLFVFDTAWKQTTISASSSVKKTKPSVATGKGADRSRSCESYLMTTKTTNCAKPLWTRFSLTCTMAMFEQYYCQSTNMITGKPWQFANLLVAVLTRKNLRREAGWLCHLRFALQTYSVRSRTLWHCMSQSTEVASTWTRSFMVTASG